MANPPPPTPRATVSTTSGHGRLTLFSLFLRRTPLFLRPLPLQRIQASFYGKPITIRLLIRKAAAAASILGHYRLTLCFIFVAISYSSLCRPHCIHSSNSNFDLDLILICAIRFLCSFDWRKIREKQENGVEIDQFEEIRPSIDHFEGSNLQSLESFWDTRQMTMAAM